MPGRTINGTAIWYEEQGAGKPLVLLHGFPLDHRIFDTQIAKLASKFRVIAPDLRGFGESPSDSPFTIASLADDVHALLGSIGALPCALGGLSMGGYVALAYVRKYAKDLSELLLIDTRAEGDNPEGKQGRDKMVELVRAQGSKAIAEQMLPKMFAPQTLQSNSDAVQQLRSIMEACPAKTIENALLALRDREDCISFLPSIAIPTLILVGEHDTITPPKMAQTLNEKIPRSNLLVIPGAGHVSTMEKPNEVSAAISGFVKTA